MSKNENELTIVRGHFIENCYAYYISACVYACNIRAFTIPVSVQLNTHRFSSRAFD